MNCRKNCRKIVEKIVKKHEKNREKIAKNARKLLQKIAKNARKHRQIVENGVDQVDLGGVGENPEMKKRKREKNCFFSFSCVTADFAFLHFYSCRKRL
jgi:hypothetical protein